MQAYKISGEYNQNIMLERKIISFFVKIVDFKDMAEFYWKNNIYLFEEALKLRKSNLLFNVK